MMQCKMRRTAETDGTRWMNWFLNEYTDSCLYRYYEEWKGSVMEEKKCTRQPFLHKPSTCTSQCFIFNFLRHRSGLETRYPVCTVARFTLQVEKNFFIVCHHESNKLNSKSKFNDGQVNLGKHRKTGFYCIWCRIRIPAKYKRSQCFLFDS